jgi:hypothetical protein
MPNQRTSTQLIRFWTCRPAQALTETDQKGPSMTNVTKMAADEHRRTPAVAEDHAPRRLTSRWYKDAEGVLAIGWVIEVELDERRLPAARAA